MLKRAVPEQQRKGIKMENENQTPHKRRVHYKGKYPKKFEENIKNYSRKIQRHHRACHPERQHPGRHAYLHYGKRNS